MVGLRLEQARCREDELSCSGLAVRRKHNNKEVMGTVYLGGLTCPLPPGQSTQYNLSTERRNRR